MLHLCLRDHVIQYFENQDQIKKRISVFILVAYICFELCAILAFWAVEETLSEEQLQRWSDNYEKDCGELEAYSALHYANLKKCLKLTIAVFMAIFFILIKK